MAALVAATLSEALRHQWIPQHRAAPPSTTVKHEFHLRSGETFGFLSRLCGFGLIRPLLKVLQKCRIQWEDNKPDRGQPQVADSNKVASVAQLAEQLTLNRNQRF